MTWGQVDPTSPIAQMLGVSTGGAAEHTIEQGSEPPASSEKLSEAGTNPGHASHHDPDHRFAFKLATRAEGAKPPYQDLDVCINL